MKKADKEKLIIFAHSGSFDKLYQIATLALTASAMEKEVYIFIFFSAFKKFTSGEMDKIDISTDFGIPIEDFKKTLKDKNIPSISSMLRDAKKIGNVKVIACSAQLELMGVESNRLGDLVDDVWGLPTILNTIRGAETTLFI